MAPRSLDESPLTQITRIAILKIYKLPPLPPTSMGFHGPTWLIGWGVDFRGSAFNWQYFIQFVLVSTYLDWCSWIYINFQWFSDMSLDSINCQWFLQFQMFLQISVGFHKLCRIFIVFSSWILGFLFIFIDSNRCAWIFGNAQIFIIFVKVL